MTAHFVICHKAPIWNIPFEHTQIGVEGYRPESEGGLCASDFISHQLDSETALGALRALPVIQHELEKGGGTTPVFVSSYRVFLTKELNYDWISPALQDFNIVSPEKFSAEGNTLVLREMPPDIDLVIPSPRLLPDTVMGQYSRLPSHHLEDLLLGVSCAIRSGLLNGKLVPRLLSSNTFIAYNGIFASHAKLRLDYYERLWWAVEEFYKTHYRPRFGYERRVIDFVFERVTSMALIQMVVDQKLRCASSRVLLVSETGGYVNNV